MGSASNTIIKIGVSRICRLRPAAIWRGEKIRIWGSTTEIPKEPKIVQRWVRETEIYNPLCIIPGGEYSFISLRMKSVGFNLTLEQFLAPKERLTLDRKSVV